MNKTAAIKAIKAMGLSVRSTGFGSELRITYRLDDPRLQPTNCWHSPCTCPKPRERAEQVAYYTDDPEDAIATAKMMAESLEISKTTTELILERIRRQIHTLEQEDKTAQLSDGGPDILCQ